MAVEVVSMRRAAHYIAQPGDVRIDRATQFGNPFVLHNEHDDVERAAVIEQYRAWLAVHPAVVTALRALNPKRLVCWCAPRACHGDVLAEALAAASEGADRG